MKKTFTIALVISILALVAVAVLAGDPPKAGAAVTQGKVYVCDKCDVAYDKPGKCACGRELKAVDKSDIYYECDMCKVKSDKPGKCPKCNMDMKLHVASWEKAKAAAAAPAKS